ncbi:MAG: hypothetical protein AAGA87_16780 [Pseudomonadota bacterium]
MMDPVKLSEKMHEKLTPGARQIKLARLITDVVDDDVIRDSAVWDRLVWVDTREDDFSMTVIDEAIALLIERDDVQAYGNTLNWRYSEVRRRSGEQ